MSKNKKPYYMMKNAIPDSHKHLKKDILNEFNDPEYSRDLIVWIKEGVIHGKDIDSLMNRIFPIEESMFVNCFKWKEIEHCFSLKQYKRYKEHLRKIDAVLKITGVHNELYGKQQYE